MRRRGRQLQPNGGRERPHAVHACDLGQDARDSIQSIQGRDDHCNDGRGDPDQQDRNERQAEDCDQHRIEDEDRYRVIGREKRIERLPQSRERMNQQPKSEAEGDRQDHRDDDDPQGSHDVAVDAARCENAEQRDDHLGGRDDDAMIDQAASARELEGASGPEEDHEPDPAGSSHAAALPVWPSALIDSPRS
jgi:hypothetical protein